MAIEIKINNRKSHNRNFRLLVLCLIIILGIGAIKHVQARLNDLDEKRVVKEVVSVLSPPSVKEKGSKINNPLTVPFIQQMPELPRGCEVTSLAMLLNYAGVNVSKLELASKIDKIPFEIDGLKGDMNEGFLGDMYSLKNPGLGVYVKPIYKLANQYLPGRIVDLTQQPIEQLYEVIDSGSPVWVITNSTFQLLPENEFREFNTKNGSMKVTYREHSVVVTGYSEEYIYLNDPLAEAPEKRVDRQAFEEAWVQMGSQAISVDIV